MLSFKLLLTKQKYPFVSSVSTNTGGDTHGSSKPLSLREVNLRTDKSDRTLVLLELPIKNSPTVIAAANGDSEQFIGDGFPGSITLDSEDSHMTNKTSDATEVITTNKETL